VAGFISVPRPAPPKPPSFGLSLAVTPAVLHHHQNHLKFTGLCFLLHHYFLEVDLLGVYFLIHQSQAVPPPPPEPPESTSTQPVGGCPPFPPPVLVIVEKLNLNLLL
jgi:hypothetical protein